jgi:hypothetical protein
MTYTVYAKIQHADGEIETRRWLEGFTSYAEAKQAADSAVKFNDCVLEAWVG